MSRVCASVLHVLTLFAAAMLWGLFAGNSPAKAFDTTGLAMWLDANDINGDGNTGNNPAYLSSVDLWIDKSGNANNAFVTPVGDPPGGFPGASGGLPHAEVIGPLDPPPVWVDHNDPMEEHALSPSGLPAVRFNTCNDAPLFLGCNVTPPTYPNQTGLMTNYHAHPDPAAIGDELGLPAVPDLTVAAVVRPWFIEVASYHPIWTFDGNLGGHNRSLGIHYDPGNKTGLNAGTGVVYEDSLDNWMIAIMTFDYDGTDADPNPQPRKLYVNSPEAILATDGPESILSGTEDSPMTIGWFPYNYVHGNNISMLLSEFIVLERTLTDGEVNSLGFELAQKYGITTTFASVDGVDGDYNDDGTVDAADYVVWRHNVGTSNVLPNDSIGGMIGPAHYDQWKANFGSSRGSSSAHSSNAVVPEPSLLLLGVTAAIGLLGTRSSRWSS